MEVDRTLPDPKLTDLFEFQIQFAGVIDDSSRRATSSHPSWMQTAAASLEPVGTFRSVLTTLDSAQSLVSEYQIAFCFFCSSVMTLL